MGGTNTDGRSGGALQCPCRSVLVRVFFSVPVRVSPGDSGGAGRQWRAFAAERVRSAGGAPARCASRRLRDGRRLYGAALQDSTGAEGQFMSGGFTESAVEQATLA